MNSGYSRISLRGGRGGGGKLSFGLLCQNVSVQQIRYGFFFNKPKGVSDPLQYATAYMCQPYCNISSTPRRQPRAHAWRPIGAIIAHLTQYIQLALHYIRIPFEVGLGSLRKLATANGECNLDLALHSMDVMAVGNKL